MIKHNIDLSRFLPKGQVSYEIKNNMLHMRTNRAIPTQRLNVEHLSINSYLYLSGQYRLPLRIDITAKIDAPGLYLLLGKGHISFGSLWSDNRRIDDIISPARKTMFYHNEIPMNEFTEISVLYDLKEMQILINGEERYYSKNERYMKAPSFGENNKEGFEFKIACDKLVELCMKEVTIIEYEDSCGICPSGGALPAAIKGNNVVNPGEKPDFDGCISRLPDSIRSEIVQMDAYLKALKPLKFKRQIEKNGNKITYVASDYGLSYAIYLSNQLFDHSLQWYIITNGKPETWHRKANRMEETLNRLEQRLPDYSGRMFENLDECVGCGPNCLARTQYHYQDKSKAVCHGKLKFKMSTSGLEDARTFINEVNNLIQETE